MRVNHWLFALILGMAWAFPSMGQSVSLFGGSATGTQIQNVPINTSQNVVGPTNLGTFNLTNMFHRVPFFGGNPIIGQSPMPSPGSFRSTHYKNKLNPFVPVSK